ncbi:MAG: adenine phosphoribosyltransferase [Kiritimatiellia bacterium]
MSIEAVKQAIRDVPDFPQKGIIFKDITPVLNDPKLFKIVIDEFAARYQKSRIEKIAAVESRGFLLGSVLAYKLGAGLVPVRKKGKLPADTIEASYALEYGTATIEIHTDAVKKGERVLIIDDLLATGGTAAATASMVKQLGGDIVEIAFLIELAFLKGREKLSGYPVFAPIAY